MAGDCNTLDAAAGAAEGGLKWHTLYITPAIAAGERALRG